MVSRQLRLNSLELIRNRLKEFTGRKINIVLSNRTVLFGELKSITDAKLTFVNMRLDPVSLSLEDIAEVYVDFKE
ncbi:MAG: hypothetical protein M3Y60_01205 [Bacteroidota bacterium]|nr:hypothetical protein [Bacteroidota bacterium]